METQFRSVGQVARELQVRPDQISNLFYKRQLRDDLCPIVAGRRLIPRSYTQRIAAALRRKGIEVRPAGDAQEGGNHVHGES